MSNNSQQKFHKLLGLALSHTTVTAIISISLVGCSVFQNKGKSSDKGHTDPKSVKSEPTFHHGFGGDPDTFKLIDRMDTRELANLVKDEEAAKKIQTGPKPSLIYTGKSLGLKDCSIAPKGADHIAEIWKQEYLLGLFIAPSLGLKTAIESLEEADPRGNFRPFFAVHPDLKKRLADGVKDKHWVLNAIRFRIADPSSVDVAVDSDGGFERQAVPVMGQIKLNYELDRYSAKTDPTIASASFIHSIAINHDYIGEFIKDVFSIRQDASLSGCDVLATLNKYIRSTDLTLNKQPRGSYFFLHTNIFDTKPEINEWRFTEHKLVTNDTEPFTAESYNQRRNKLLKDLIANLNTETSEPGSPDTVTDDQKTAASGEATTSSTVSELCKKFSDLTGQTCPELKTDDETAILESQLPKEYRNSQIFRGIAGAHETPLKATRGNFALRIVPLQFPRFYVTGDFNHLELAADKSPLSIWFSGTLSDFGSNPASRDLGYDLITYKDGSTVDANHPVRRHEETKTCAQCHASNHDTRFDPKSLKLGDIASMNFRHIGFGDGGNRRCNPFFGLVRPDFKASLSTYLIKTANGAKMNGYADSDIRKAPDKMGPFAAFNGSSFAQENGIDMVRCFNVDGSAESIKP